MNCEEFRHQLLIDPLSKDAALRDHARACPDCARATLDVLQFEETLRQALAAEVCGTATEEHRPGTPARGRGFALLFLPLLSLLSLLLLAIWLGVSGGLGPDSRGNPGADVIQHIQAEEEHLSAEGAVPRVQLRRLFRILGADVDPDLGPVIYAGRCIIGEGEGIHLILPGERGAVTALFIPGKETDEEMKITGAGLAGTLVPAGFGLLAVVGVPGEPLEPMVRRLRRAVRWDKTK